MTKIAFVFPGQGSQYVGMAREFIESDSETQELLSIFQQKTGFNLSEIMLDGPEDKLKETRFTQPAILLHSLAAFSHFRRQSSLKPVFVAGHSLGEFSALAAAGCLNVSDAMYLVHRRGEFMIKAGQGSSYAMAAIIGLQPETVKSICRAASDFGIVIAANFNTPVQTVISGSEEGVKRACELAAEEKAKRIVPLVVGGAFHSPLVAKAEAWLMQEIEKIDFNAPQVPLVSNVDALPHTDLTEIKTNLGRQIRSSVLWLDSIRYMINAGVDTFIEFGPAKVLSGMLRKIDRKASSFNIEKPADTEVVLEKINELL